MISANDAQREKKTAALSSVGAAIGLTSLKIIVALLTGSLGMLAEAAHSGLDLVAALMTFFALRVADRPADATHHYWQGKVENLSAFLEAGCCCSQRFGSFTRLCATSSFQKKGTLMPRYGRLQ